MRQQGTPPRRGFSWQQTFAALKYPNYRLWFFGQLVSLFGYWMKITAEGYLIYELTSSPVYLGYVSFASGIPVWLFMLYAGVLADRMSRRTLLIIAQLAMAGVAAILAALTFTHMVQPWHVILLATVTGMANAIDAPARQAFVLEMVDREDLTNAIALNSSMFNAATAIGPAAAGVIYAAFGPAWCFLINALGYSGVITALVLMKLKPRPAPPRRRSALVEMAEGLRYVATNHIIRVLVGLVAVVSLFGASFNTLIPAWAVDILKGGSTTNGLLQSARGFGSLISALTIASLGRFAFRGRLLSFGSLAFPCALLAFSAVRWLPLSLLALVGVGASQMLMMNLANSVVQTTAGDELRGRVMGIYSLVFFGLMPLGGLLAGALAQNAGAPATIVFGACVTLAAALAVRLFLPQVRSCA